jgi:hypothetical protein
VFTDGLQRQENGMNRSASQLRTAALFGLAIGGALTGIAVMIGSVDFESPNLAIWMLGYLIAVPPFIYTPLLSLPFAGALVVIPVWWIGVGIFLALCIRQPGRSGAVIAVIGIGLLAAGHLLARNAIVAEMDALEAAIGAVAKGLGTLK